MSDRGCYAVGMPLHVDPTALAVVLAAVGSTLFALHVAVVVQRRRAAAFTERLLSESVSTD